MPCISTTLVWSVSGGCGAGSAPGSDPDKDGELSDVRGRTFLLVGGRSSDEVVLDELELDPPLLFSSAAGTAGRGAASNGLSSGIGAS